MKPFKAYLRKHLPYSVILWSHELRAIWAVIRFGFPARGMLVIGITGTKGKTTSTHFVTSILEAAGHKVGMVTTINFKIGDKEWSNEENKSSLPPHQLQKLLRDMRRAGCTALVIEVTSHGLMQHRVWGIPFRHVGLTNITHDHLDYHPTWEHYRDTKLRLFLWKSLKSISVNGNDPSAELFLQKSKARIRSSFGLSECPVFPGATSTLLATRVSTNSGGSSFTLVNGVEELRATLQLAGRFNIENALCAAAICLNMNIPLSIIAEGLHNLTAVAGRLEKIETKKGFSIMIDYAHTPDSLEKLYSTLREDVRGRMIAVLGSCGDRDRTKRPIMGAIAARFCDYVFVTDEEPYTEQPEAIIEEVAKGVPRGRPLFQSSNHRSGRMERPILKKENDSGEREWWWKVADRREAISRAIDLGKLDDIILVTGMGAQNFKIVGDKKVPWNDRQVIESLLTEKNLL